MMNSGYPKRFLMKHQIKIIVEKNTDGYVAYPLGLKGVVVGQGDTYDEAIADVKSAITFHFQTFGYDKATNKIFILFRP
jgi:predicted RNase H-like HicB family nuclease